MLANPATSYRGMVRSENLVQRPPKGSFVRPAARAPLWFAGMARS